MHRWLVGHECQSVSPRGWGGIKNGDLLRLAEGEFDLCITSDQNIRYQQNLAGRRIAILELSTNKLRRLHAAMALIKSAVDGLRAADYRRLEIP